MAAGDSGQYLVYTNTIIAVSISIEVYSSKELERSHCQSTELSTSACMLYNIFDVARFFLCIDQQPVEATDQGKEKANLVAGIK